MTGNRLFCLLAALAAALCLTVTAALAAEVTLDADRTSDFLAPPAAGEELILDLNGHTLTVTDGTLTNAGRLTIRDSSAARTGKLIGRVLNEAGATLTLESGTITGGSGTYGGGVCSSGTFLMTGGAITGNTATEPGGGVYISGADAVFTMTGGVISDNRCLGTTQQLCRGGGVYVSSGTFTMEDGAISGNAAGSAGGVGLLNGTFHMTGGTISGNKAGVMNGAGELTAPLGIGGGGIAMWSELGSVVIEGGVLSDNTAYDSGGAIKVYRGTAELTGVTVTGNKLAKKGLAYGGAFAVGGVGTDATEVAMPHRLTIGPGCLILGNGSDVPASAYPSGAFLLGSVGFAGRGGEIVLTGGTVTDNSPANANGVFYLHPTAPGTMTMTGGAITGNTVRGGAVWISPNAAFTMSGGEISNNTATNTAGAGVFLNDTGAVFHMTDGVISGNRTQVERGAGVGVRGGTFLMDGGSITGNQTLKDNQSGAGVAVYNASSFTMNGGSVTGNTSAWNGGGVYVSNDSTFTMNGGEVSGNVAGGGTGHDLLVIGGSSEASFIMNGGTFALEDDRDVTRLNVFSTSTTRASARLLGGVIRSGLHVSGAGARNTVDVAGAEIRGCVTTGGDSPDNVVRIWNGKVRALTSAHTGITVYGGAFHSPVYLTDAAASSDLEVTYSGLEGYGYQLSPALAGGVSADAAMTLLTAEADSAPAGWTSYADVETTRIRVPVTADFRIGDRTVTGVAVAKADGRYTAAAAVTAADSGAALRITFRDEAGEPIRVLTGKAPVVLEAGGMGGDLTGDEKVNAKDIVHLQRSLVGGYGVTLTLAQADLNGDGKVNAKDVVALSRFVAGGYGVALADRPPVVSDDPADDEEMNLLFVGNSYCYYWTDELYGLLTAAGYENVSVCNVYYSGGTLAQHWNWLVDGQANYRFCIVDKDGRREVEGLDLNACFAYKNWDVVETQQGNSPMYTGGFETARTSVRTYLPLLLSYMKEQAPKARFYWQSNWAREVEHDDDPIETVADQALYASYFRAIAQEVREQYGLLYAPASDAWQRVRFDDLITAGGRRLTTRIYLGRADYDDYTHDGDVGGGQYLNACLWYELVTGSSCLDNAYRPEYVFQGTDYSLSEEQIDLLQTAAHQTMVDVYGADFFQP